MTASPNSVPSPIRLVLDRAIAAGADIVSIDYTDAAGASSTRDIKPRSIMVSKAGDPSVFAWCTRAGATRKFRIDRITAVLWGEEFVQI
jgi:predicted DNA-binding transcriptional regulator YafY